MRKVTKLIFVTILIVITSVKGFCSENNVQNVFNWKNVIKAIAHIESRGDSTIVSRSGNHVGYLQISKVMIRDCNEKAGYKKYTYNDRYSKIKSIEIFLEVQRNYNPQNNIEKAIRSWNGGQGYTIANTNNYFHKVTNRLKIIKKESN